MQRERPPRVSFHWIRVLGGRSGRAFVALVERSKLRAAKGGRVTVNEIVAAVFLLLALIYLALAIKA